MAGLRKEDGASASRQVGFARLSLMTAYRPISLFRLALFVLPLLCAAAVLASDIKGDAASGKSLFMTSACVTCHGVTKADTMMVGPSLFGIVGRQAGTGKSLLGASENLKKYGVIWSAQTLDEFLADPNAKVPGTPMIGKLADPQQRADVIAYLETLKE